MQLQQQRRQPGRRQDFHCKRLLQRHQAPPSRRRHRWLPARSQYVAAPKLLALECESYCAVYIVLVQATGACQMDDASNADLVDTVAMAIITGMQGNLSSGLDKLRQLTGTAYERCGSCLSLQSEASFESMVRTCIGASLR